jgi:hypothetical protein
MLSKAGEHDRTRTRERSVFLNFESAQQFYIAPCWTVVVANGRTNFQSHDAEPSRCQMLETRGY